MKRFLALMLLATPALAQEQQKPPAIVRALDEQIHEAVEREAAANIRVVQLQDAVAELQRQVEVLKAAAEKPTTTKP